MRDKQRDPDRLRHMLEAITNVKTYSAGISKKQFLVDTMRYHAIVYNLMIIGEAAYMLTQDFCDAHPDTPWKQIKGMRHFLVHGYLQVEKDFVWEVLERDLDVLEKEREISHSPNKNVRDKKQYSLRNCNSPQAVSFLQAHVK